jgi:hypothetical protein
MYKNIIMKSIFVGKRDSKGKKASKATLMRRLQVKQ